jgi:PfaB family protein
MEMQQQRAAFARRFSMAVSGVDVQTKTCNGAAAFEQAVFDGKNLFQCEQQEAANGKRPAEIRLRQSVEGALADAGINQGGAVGILIVSEDAAIPGSPVIRRARPLAAINGLSGPVEDWSADAMAAFHQAVHMLEEEQVQAVVVGWISQEYQSAAALVLRRTTDASLANQKVYAVVDTVSPMDFRPDEIGYLQGVGQLTNHHLKVLIDAYSQNTGKRTCAFGNDEDFPFIPALIKATLCLYHRFIPAANSINDLISLDDRFVDSSFYVASESRTWFQPETAGPRKAAIFCEDIHLILSEEESNSQRFNQSLQASDLQLYPIAGDTLDDLLAGLSALKADVSGSDDLQRVAHSTLETYALQPDAAYAVGIMGRGREETLREIEYALKGAANAFEKGADWQTPLGSTFSPAPVGRDGSIAFVYPGAFNSYLGMGRELFRLFPHLHERFGEVTADIGGVMCEELLYPRSQSPLSEVEKVSLEARLNDDPIAMLKSGTTLSTLYTMILQDIFGVEPEAAFGYSLGENSMLFAMGIWTNGDETSRRLSESDLFRTRLSGSQDAVREYWQMAPGEHPDPLWLNYLVMAAPERVYAAMQNEPHVYLTHINTPRQVVIGGEPEACKRVIQSLHCAHLQAPFTQALHNDAMRSEQPALSEMHYSPVITVPRTRLYSAAAYQPLPIEQQQIADSLGHMLCSHLDFPRLIEQVYAGGARVFIELGAGSNCSKWVDETLQGKTACSHRHQPARGR